MQLFYVFGDNSYFKYKIEVWQYADSTGQLRA